MLGIGDGSWVNSGSVPGGGQIKFEEATIEEVVEEARTSFSCNTDYWTILMSLAWWADEMEGMERGMLV
jgi:hypothetical protein